MKHRWKSTWNVTRWEFNRFFKWKDMIKGLLFFLFFGFIGGVTASWLTSDSISIPNVAVTDYSVFSPSDFETEEIAFFDHTQTAAEELAIKMEAGEVDAILTIHSPDEATIRMPNDRAWLMNLRQILQDLRLEQKLQQFEIDRGVYSALEEEVVLNREFDSGSESSVADKVVAGIAIFLVLMAVFMGFAYQFTAITGEKQQRITEQVISAIDPQTWIDGKILGITGIGLVYVVFYGGLSLIGALLLVQFTGAPFGSAISLINPLFVIIFLILSLLGVLMWNSFLAGVAATIDDPNSSERSAFMFLPMLPVFFAFFALVNPDGTAITTLGIFPLTSFAVLPARMVLTQVAWWEPLLAIALLAATAWLFRIIAAKIFATGMMMYGKEPSIKEMARWFIKS